MNVETRVSQTSIVRKNARAELSFLDEILPVRALIVDEQLPRVEARFVSTYAGSQPDVQDARRQAIENEALSKSPEYQAKVKLLREKVRKEYEARLRAEGWKKFFNTLMSPLKFAGRMLEMLAKGVYPLLAGVGLIAWTGAIAVLAGLAYFAPAAILGGLLMLTVPVGVAMQLTLPLAIVAAVSTIFLMGQVFKFATNVYDRILLRD